MKKEDIIAAYLWIRSNNNSIPDDVLDLMKDSAIAAIQPIEHKSDIEQEAERHGHDLAMQKVLACLKENYEASKNLVDEDKVRSAQETVNETYEDLIYIFTQANQFKTQSLTSNGDGVEAIEFAEWLHKERITADWYNKKVYWFDNDGEGMGDSKQVYELFKNK